MMAMEVMRQATIEAIESLHKPEETLGPKILHAIYDEQGNMGLEAVYHRDICWSWLECVKAWFGYSTYNLPTILHVIQKLDLFDKMPEFQQNGIIGIMNRRIQHYNERRWLYQLPFLEGRMILL